MKKLWKEFIAFINKGNALALAIGVIIGGAFSTIVGSINSKIISPLIGALLGDYDLSESLITVLNYETDAEGNQVIANAIYWGAFIQACIDFLLTAVILFAIFKTVSSISNAAKRTAQLVRDRLDGEEEVVEEVKEEVVPAEPVIPEDILLLKEIRDLLAAKNAKEE